MSVLPNNRSALSQETHDAKAISGSKMPSLHTEPASEGFSSKSGMETQLSLSESPKEDEEKPEENPFTIPPDANIFSMRDKERRKAKMERERMKTMKIHEKMTYCTKAKAKQTELMKGLQKEEEEEARKQETNNESLKTLQKTLSGKLPIKTDYPLQKRSLHDEINDLREIFYLEYAMAVMREEMQKMDSTAEREERKLEEAERKMKKDAAAFYEAQKERQKQYSQALESVRKEVAAQEEKTREIQEINSQIEDVKSDIVKMKNTLQEYKLYRDFFYKLSPKEWQEKHGKKGTKGKYLKAFLSTGELSSLADVESETSSDEDEEPELYFTDPQQVLSVLTKMEEDILSLIQNPKDTNTTVDKLITECVSKEKKLAELKQQVATLKSATAKEEEKKADLKLKVHLCFSEAEEQDKMLESLKKKVQEVYRHYTGESGANLQTEQMLIRIEKQVHDLLDELETIPPETLNPIVKAKQKEWRLRLREEKRRQEKQQEEERLKRMLKKPLSDAKMSPDAAGRGTTMLTKRSAEQ
ncbi:cilia- and flagella-associated protein 100 [Pogoniulus pusillus]|uniref:cilia- and flagella-associated protein 100 n=1 Tax=Pogoniulus pusillus TaxID=488313 RepID=UPI0030B991D9